MTQSLVALGWVGVMILIGTFLKAHIAPLQRLLIPSCVIGGVVGLVLANTVGFFAIGTDNAPFRLDGGVFGEIVTQLFTLSFISMGLAGIKKSGGASKSVFKGTMGIGIIWVLLYSLTPVIGVLVLLAVNGVFHADPTYGLLVPFAFCQGPGQAATFGAIFESYGVQDAANVGVTFAAVGFIAAFGIGVPMARAGIRKGYAQHYLIENNPDSPIVAPVASNDKKASAKGVGSKEGLAFAFVLIALAYVITDFAVYLISILIPPLADTIGGLMFMMGMLIAYGVKAVLDRTKLAAFHDTVIQHKISNWMTDFLVAAAFMAVTVSAIIAWIAPIFLVSAVIALVTHAICVYFGRRIGGSNDFERTLGLFGTSMGTIPCGVSLVGIVDPESATTTNTELGLMNLPMMLSSPTILIMLAMAAGTLSLGMGLALLLLTAIACLVLLKAFKVWGRKTY